MPWSPVSRVIGPFAPMRAAASYYHQPLPSSRLLGQELLLGASPDVAETSPDVAAGTFTRTLTLSQNPTAWLGEVRDVEGNLVDVAIGDDVDDVYLDLAESMTPPKAD